MSLYHAKRQHFSFRNGFSDFVELISNGFERVILVKNETYGSPLHMAFEANSPIAVHNSIYRVVHGLIDRDRPTD